MKRLLTSFAILILSIPSIGFADDGQTCTTYDDGSTICTGDGGTTSTNSDWSTYAPGSNPALQSSTSTPTGTSAPASGNCNFDPNDNQGPGAISSALKGCKPKGMIETKGDYKIESWVRSRVVDIANNLILIGSILAVGAIVYAAILYTIAAGDEERIKSAKNALKFGIIGFAVMLISFGLVNAIVRLFYATSGG